MTAPASVNLAKVVYGADEPPLDDLAENLHEASKLNATLSGVELRGAAMLQTHEELIWSTSRGVREHDGYLPVELPDVALPEAGLGTLLRRRRSVGDFAPRSVSLGTLACVLGAGYGVTGIDERPDGGPMFPHRTVPSGGGLYPLELYVVALRVDDLAEGVYHYHPLRHRLELVRAAPLQELLAPALVYHNFLDAAFGVVVAGIFWRSRFKYGLRGYRFTLLEAGHVTQNLLLAAGAFGLASCPCGGFFERKLDPLLELDGVEASALVSVFVGEAA